MTYVWLALYPYSVYCNSQEVDITLVEDLIYRNVMKTYCVV